MKLYNVSQAIKVGALAAGIIAVATLSSCGHHTSTVVGVPGATGEPGLQGPKGDPGQQGYGAGISTQAVASGATCAAGGIELDTFQDLNNNGLWDSGESLVGLSYVCNGTNGQNGHDGTNGVNGTNGQDGATGATGANGSNGHDGTNGTNGSNGTDGAQGAAGTNGSNGTNGTNGTNGADGVSSTFSIVADTGAHCTNGGFDVTLTDSTHSTTEYVCNGVNGTNGSNGQAGTNGAVGASGGTVTFNLVQAIMPCGANSSPWKEVILGLQGGQLLSSFSESASGQNTRFSFIPNGSYTDTDSSGCQFTVTGDGLNTSDISWAGGGYAWTLATGWVAHN